MRLPFRPCSPLKSPSAAGWVELLWHGRSHVRRCDVVTMVICFEDGVKNETALQLGWADLELRFQQPAHAALSLVVSLMGVCLSAVLGGRQDAAGCSKQQRSGIAMAGAEGGSAGGKQPASNGQPQKTQGAAWQQQGGSASPRTSSGETAWLLYIVLAMVLLRLQHPSTLCNCSSSSAYW